MYNCSTNMNLKASGQYDYLVMVCPMCWIMWMELLAMWWSLEYRTLCNKVELHMSSLLELNAVKLHWCLSYTGCGKPRNVFPEVFSEFCPGFQVSSPARAAFQESPSGQLLCQVHCKKAPHRCKRPLMACIDNDEKGNAWFIDDGRLRAG